MSRQRNYALAAAEAGLDFARRELNASLLTGERSQIEPQPGEPYHDYGLPVHYLPQLGNRCSVIIRVSRVTSDVLTLIQAQQAALDPLNVYQKSIPLDINTSLRKEMGDWKYKDDWRLFAIPSEEDSPNESYTYKVEVAATCGVFTTSIRSIMVGAYPDTTIGAPTDPNDSFFPQSLMSNSELTVGAERVSSIGPLDSNQVNGQSPSSFKAVLQSNEKITALPNTSIYGDLKVSNPETDMPVAVNEADLLGNSATVYGRIFTNGNEMTANFNGTPDASRPSDTDSVKALADMFQNPEQYDLPDEDGGGRLGLNKESPIQEESSSAQNQVTPNPVPTPSNSAPLPSFYIPPADGVEPVDVPSPQVPSGNSYKTPAFDSSGNADATLTFNADGQGPTKIFVEDAMGAYDEYAVNVRSSNIDNRSNAPTDLQIYYAGEKKVKLYIEDGHTMNVLIYSPAADVQIEGPGNFRGAIVGKKISLKNTGTVELDSNAANVIADRSNAGAANTQTASGHGIKPTHYRILTWQQVSGNILRN